MAAQLSYYFALALFPALLFVVALASYLPYDVITDVVNSMASFAPPDVLSIIRGQLESIVVRRTDRHPDHWHSRRSLEQLRRHDVDRVRPQQGVRHSRNTTLVESAPHRDRTDDRDGRLYPVVVLDHPGRPERRSVAGGMVRPVIDLRPGVDSGALAADVRVRDIGDRDGLLFCARCRSGLGVGDARLDRDNAPVGVVLAAVPAST